MHALAITTIVEYVPYELLIDAGPFSNLIWNELGLTPFYADFCQELYEAIVDTIKVGPVKVTIYGEYLNGLGSFSYTKFTEQATLTESS